MIRSRRKSENTRKNKSGILQSVHFDDLSQDRPLVRHGRRKVDEPWWRQHHPEEVGELGPQACHLTRSLLVMLKAWLAHFGSVAIHSTAFAGRAPSVDWQSAVYAPGLPES